ncbi:hypothetical protein [Devosia sp. CN2-171]|uniref:hypothetical protein n=1 Tax=Devosia sp. CN2-171 TaxID=3400909 RepID=UPI003BF89E65
MSILWLARYAPLPPANGGDAQYSRNLIQAVAKQTRVEVLCFSDVAIEPGTYGARWHHVPRQHHSRIAGLLSPLPDVAYRHAQSEFTRKALELAATVDTVFVDHIGLFWIVPILARTRASAKSPRIVVVNHDHEAALRKDMAAAASNPLTRLVLRFDAGKAAALERRANLLADGLTAISTTDQAEFTQLAPETANLLVMPGYDGPVVPERRIDEGTDLRICVLGGRGALHKKMVLRLILRELVRQGIPQRYIVDVVGSGEASGFEVSGINFLGYVESISDYLSTVRLGLIPDEVGGGFKLRLLTHVFHRVPMLGLRKAIDGSTLRPQVDYADAADITDLVTQIDHLIGHVDRLNELQNNAFSHCADRFKWDDRGTDLAKFSLTLTGRDPAAATVPQL